MNWGKGIVIGMSLFMAFILVLVISLMSHSVDLESEDYYQREINYQSEITAMKKSNGLNEKVEMTSMKDYVSIVIPNELNCDNVEVILIRPDNKDLDQTFKINNTKSYLIDKTKLVKGHYNVEIRYQIEGSDYLQKQTIII
jgi:hypothetical protein